MADKSIGFIETFGLAACVAAADAAVKSANVKLLGFEYAKGDGMCTVKVEVMSEPAKQQWKRVKKQQRLYRDH